MFLLMTLFINTNVAESSHPISNSITIPQGQHKVFPNLGSCALIDGTTGQVYWASGRTLTTASTSHHLPFPFNYITPEAFKLPQHFKSVCLTLSICFFFFRSLVQSLLLFHPPAQVPHDFLSSVVLNLLPHAKTIASLYILYLLESLTSSTNKYLTNKISSPEAFDIIENFRRLPPTVTWTIKHYHFEDRYGFRMRHPQQQQPQQQQQNQQHHSKLSKKVYSATATDRYVFGGWSDMTNGFPTTFSRARPKTTTQTNDNSKTPFKAAPLKKISLSKLLVFSSAEARDEYGRQLTGFIGREHMRDDHYDFETRIDMGAEGQWRDKLLVLSSNTKRDENAADSNLLNENKKLSFVPRSISRFWYWFFTLLMLTVPYRWWFGGQCDELSIQVVKKTYARADGLDGSISGKETAEKENLVSTAVGNMFPKTKFFAKIPPPLEAEDDSKPLSDVFTQFMEKNSLYYGSDGDGDGDGDGE